MHQLTYTVPFGIVASEVIFFNHSLVNEDTYIYMYPFFTRSSGGGSISAPVIKERKEKNPTPPCTKKYKYKYVSFRNC